MSAKKDTFFILDGNALLHRAWHALPPLMTKSGRVVNAAYGFAMVLEKMLEQFHPTYMAVAWDLPGKTFRHKDYEAYKAHREKKAQELYDQIPLVQDLLKIYGIPSLSAEGYEADDVIATLATKAGQKKIETFVVTGDLDSLQLVDESTKVIFFQKGISETKIYDIAAVKERYGLTPAQLIDYKALRGDPSDNLPGVAGVGEKTAAELVQQFGSVKGIFEALKNEEVPIKYAKKLSGHEELALQTRRLVELVHNVPFPFAFEDARVTPPNPTKLIQVYRDLEFKSLLRKYSAVEAPPMEQKRSKVPGPVVEIVRDLKKWQSICANLSQETIGVQLVKRTNNLFGIPLAAAAVSDGTTTAIVADPTTEHLTALFEALKGAGQVITHDLKSLMHLTSRRPDTRWFDLMIASYLLNSGSRAHDLPSILNDQIEMRVPELSDAYATEKEYLLLGNIVSAFPKLADTMAKKLEKDGMREIFNEIEMPLVPVLYDMEASGIEVDTQALATFSKTLAKKLKSLESRITKLAGETFNVNSPSQLSVILFERLKLSTKGIKKTIGGFSTAASELEKLVDAHEIIPLLSEYRELAKLQSTYVEALPVLVSKDGRIHTTYNQTIAATGRLSSSNPNLQNIPIRSELSNEIRKAFVAGKGQRLVAADYSQLELRIAAVVAKDEAFTRAFREGADIHTRTAAEVWGIPEDNVTQNQRSAAKAINFGLLYGMGPRSLARSTGMNFEEAKGFIERYFAVHPALEAYMDAMKLQAHEKGYVETPFGRRRYFPEIHSGVPQLVASAERMAINMPIQGAEADIIKKAMIALNGWLKQSAWPARMLLQVHDELVLEVSEEAVTQVAKGLKEMMEGVVQWEVPLAVEVEAGKNWGEMKSV
ncbi:MAG: polymerase protein [Candidatus Uhrbacteria bacterium GW2011_GWA2_53_10]|uniref:DNA polymerase I n=1 Tax=Candidatus Uhrbacteria bacterium GW2011_GWA2_53_10 TaxID=1618980 RepID=A0A0G1XQB4_9BACT|nr:MAG: polymerase protein [Candidatus Uhrbacteria bacterium GW2011_GWA2_53_10]